MVSHIAVNKNQAIYHLYYLFNNFNKIDICFSGGTDSTLLLLMLKEYKLLDKIQSIIYNYIPFESKKVKESVIEICNILSVSEKLKILYTNKTNKELTEMINRDKKYISWGNNKKSNLRCCYYLKKKPTIQYYKNNDVDIILLGLKSSDGFNRMCVINKNVSKGFYYYNPNNKKAYPLQFLSEDIKNNWLEKLLKKYKIDLQISSTYCYNCPLICLGVIQK